ncbi:MAG: hypothetical protein ACRDBH_02410 [Bosea sp. (in: a-proteobacteria)]
MFRFLFRLIGLALVAAGFVQLVVDGSRSIANSALTFTPLGESLFMLLRERYLLLQPAIERHIHPLLWDPVVLYATLAPTCIVAILLGLLLIRLGRSRELKLGYVTRK